MSSLLVNAEAPWHRIERGEPEGDRLPLLSALKPERGWPRWILQVPMAWRGGWRYERLAGELVVDPFVPPTLGQPGEPWRFAVPVSQFPTSAPTLSGEPIPVAIGHPPSLAASAARSEGTEETEDGAPPPTAVLGLLVLAIYLEPRALAMESEQGACLQTWLGDDLNGQLDSAVDELLALPAHRWWQGFVPSPIIASPAWAGPINSAHDRGATGATDGADDAAHADDADDDAHRADWQELCFALAACQYPPGLLDVSPGCEADPDQAGPALASLARLHHFTRSTSLGRELSLLLLAGDQIYADASGGLADSRSGVERYARGYREFKGGPVRHLPPSVARIVHSIDDHEIVDNWEPTAGQGSGPWFEVARQAAWDHRWEAGARVGGPHCFWHSFDWRGAAFFVADARCEREPRRVANWSQARLWSIAQRDAFSAWLSRTAGRPRFMLCGSLPLPRRRTTAEHPASCLRSDAWDGYPHSLQELLGEVWRQRASGLVLLSGDEHRSGCVTVTLSSVETCEVDATVRLHSVHSSALYAPWPFAVTAAEELATPDDFEFDGPSGQRLRCRVSPWQDHPGDGFAVLKLRGEELQLWFDRAHRPLHAAGASVVPDVRLPLHAG